MGSALLAATLVAGASFLNAATTGWQHWLVFNLLFVGILVSTFDFPATTLPVFFVPSFIALAVDTQAATPPIGVGTAYALLCLAAATRDNRPSTAATGST